MKTPGNKAKGSVAFADFTSEEGCVRSVRKPQTPYRTHAIASPFVDKTPSTSVQNIITLAMTSGKVSDRKKRNHSIEQRLSPNNTPSTEIFPRRTRRGSRLFEA